VLPVQATVACGRAGQSVATLAGSQQPAVPFDCRPQTPAVEQVRAWHALPAGQSAGRQQPVVGTQRPFPTVAPAQNLSLALAQPQVLAAHVAVPPQSEVTLQHDEPRSGCFAVYVHVALLQVASFWHALAAGHSPATGGCAVHSQPLPAE
jgi:hypothetical protein